MNTNVLYKKNSLALPHSIVVSLNFLQPRPTEERGMVQVELLSG